MRAPTPSLGRRYFSHPEHGPLPALLILLTFGTGLIDAISIIGLGRVFVANMTGNIVFIGFAIARAPGFSLWGSLVAFVAFLVGAAACRNPGRGHTRCARDTGLGGRGEVGLRAKLASADCHSGRSSGPADPWLRDPLGETPAVMVMARRSRDSARSLGVRRTLSWCVLEVAGRP